MKSLIACSSCERYIHTTELHCPFCGGAVARELQGRTAVSTAATPSSAAPGGKGRSRAASFAMRTALLAGATSAAVACSDDGRPRENEATDTGGSGGVEARGGAAGAQSQAGTQNSSGGRAGSGSGGAIQLADAGPEEEADGGFVPIPIYGGAFPDPMRRARV